MAILSPKEFPEHLPLMVLRNCNLFPSCLLPLFIFEEKYRQMLRDVLNSHRMFCIGTTRPHFTGETPPSFQDLYPFTTIGFVRACVKKEDGTSNLLLQGVQRARISELHSPFPYLIGRIQPLAPALLSKESRSRCQTMAKKLQSLIEERIANGLSLSQPVCDYLRRVDDFEVFVDIAAFNLISDADARQPLLATADIEYRLQFMIDYVRSQMDLESPSP